jgi:hypothetical protein
MKNAYATAYAPAKKIHKNKFYTLSYGRDADKP